MGMANSVLVELYISLITNIFYSMSNLVHIYFMELAWINIDGLSVSFLYENMPSSFIEINLNSHLPKS